MKKVFEYIGLFIIISFSFYYTEKAALFVQSKNPIMQSINEVKEEERISSVNATITDNTIIPGINGREVNVNKSFNTMKSFGLFNKYYLIYDSIPPEISLEDNKDKIIISGNPKLRKVSIIIENNPKLFEYFDNKEYQISTLTNIKTIEEDNKHYDLINNESKEDNFKEVEQKLNNLEKNTRICLTNTLVNIKMCKKNQNYLVKPSLTLKNNIVEIKNQITNGSIIYIEKNTSKEDIDIIIDQINYQGLEIVPLKELISEKHK